MKNGLVVSGGLSATYTNIAYLAVAGEAVSKESRVKCSHLVLEHAVTN